MVHFLVMFLFDHVFLKVEVDVAFRDRRFVAIYIVVLLRFLVESLTHIHMLIYQKCRIQQFALLAFDKLPSHAFLQMHSIHTKRNHLTTFRARYHIFTFSIYFRFICSFLLVPLAGSSMNVIAFGEHCGVTELTWSRIILHQWIVLILKMLYKNML